MVRFVVDDCDLAPAAMLLEQAVKHLRLAFKPGSGLSAPLSGQQLLFLPGGFLAPDAQLVLALERLEVEYRPSHAPQVALKPSWRDRLPDCAVLIREDFQSLPDRQARCEGEELDWASGIAHCPPKGDHRHQESLPGSGRHLQGNTRDRFVPVLVGLLQSPDDCGVLGRRVRAACVKQPDQRLDSFPLAPERTHERTLACPVLQEVEDARVNARPAGVAPSAHMLANLVDRAVRLYRGVRLSPVAHTAFRIRDRQLCGARPAARPCTVRCPPVLIQSPVAVRLPIWRVQDPRAAGGRGLVRHRSP